MENRTKEIYMYLLGALVVIGTFVLSALLIFFEVPAGSRDAVMLALGIVLGLGVTVVQYFFGSSKSSSDKTQIMKETSKVEAEKVG